MSHEERQFIKVVWDHYKTQGRHTLPWRKTKSPYRILVSEVMLQQTQVERVIPKYKSFLKRFPTIKKLSEASLGEVLREWQGLGYNRRAKMLHQCAKEIMYSFRGSTPKSYEGLMELAGIGPYTAGAIMAFAYNRPIPIIETNIRTVFIHHFFPNQTNMSDNSLLELIEQTIDTKNPREWYYALMDYGANLKKTVGNQNQRSKHYTKQSTFKNSDRQIRGAILRMLTEQESTRQHLHKKLPFDIQRIDAQLERLKEEGMVVFKRKIYKLP